MLSFFAPLFNTKKHDTFFNSPCGLEVFFENKAVLIPQILFFWSVAVQTQNPVLIQKTWFYGFRLFFLLLLKNECRMILIWSDWPRERGLMVPTIPWCRLAQVYIKDTFFFHRQSSFKNGQHIFRWAYQKIGTTFKLRTGWGASPKNDILVYETGCNLPVTTFKPSVAQRAGGISFLNSLLHPSWNVIWKGSCFVWTRGTGPPIGRLSKDGPRPSAPGSLLSTPGFQ